MLTDAQKTDIRRFCGYPAYGSGAAGNAGWRFFQAYGSLEFRMNNLSLEEEAVVTNYLQTITQLELAVPITSENLDTDSATGWQHNRNERADRLALLDEWRRRLCAFFGVSPGAGLNNAGVSWLI